ncbi:hypothetical protein E1B28_013492 [Marasmius oreades]|uniref:Enhancer of polycomb-like protein n=1 Tax=Marasmius oreades TaxID=181124 RepID=A0A9P7RQI0_9AGAR|nr:uncharacterized protein E1B28_013492 [Marasmius oreades]KAG7087533.1 hypothetical protein E1B28_013492 [Marasmius oreades]
MPRPGQPPASTLRNRNRINNKSRLKIVHGNIDADPIIPDEDDEKNRLLQSVAGVDQEDANEHHLQAVLSEAALRNHSTHRLTRGSEKEKHTTPVAFIPIPDSAGVVDDYEQLYPPNRWKDTVAYIQFTSTTEECATAALANGFSYYMDERDMDWLTKNNEEARGEGTSVQGAFSCSGTRTSGRSAKAKGKEPDSPSPVSMTEDEFEFVMGLYEKMTHEKTEFLHHSLETGMAFPPFSDYQDTFSTPLPPSTFTSFSLPRWLPSSAQLVRIARAVYPYWKERRLERDGHRIIPILNFDESDSLNESYICFRRRDVKAVRKTRASQVTSSDKLARLQAEFTFPVELAKCVISREQLKRESARQSQHIWEQRIQFVELRRRYPMLAEKMDEELLVDRERLSKKPELRGVKIPPKADVIPPQTPQVVRPKDRIASIQNKIEGFLQKHKEVDQHWEDAIDTGYVPPPSAHPSRLFKYINTSDAPKALSPEGGEEITSGQSYRRSVRMRYGRGGRMFVDRRVPFSNGFSSRLKRTREDPDDDTMDVDCEEDEEHDRRLKERWRFDSDDGPPYGPNGSDEQDRALVNDFETRSVFFTDLTNRSLPNSVSYMRCTVNLLSEPDYVCLLPDPTIIRTGPDGRKEAYLPFKLGQPPRPCPVNSNQPMISQTAQAAASVPVSQQMKMQVQHATANVNMLPQHMRISAGRRPPSASVAATVPIATSASPPRQMPQPTHNGTGGRPAINMPHVDAVNSLPKVDGTALLGNGFASITPAPSLPQPQLQQQSSLEVMEPQTPQQQQRSGCESGELHSSQQQENGLGHSIGNSQLKYQLKPHDQQQHSNYSGGMLNGNPAAHLNGYSGMPTYVLPPAQQQTSALSLQQVQNLKSVFAAAAAPQVGTQMYMHHVVPSVKGNGQPPNGMNINLKVPPNVRQQQMQWPASGGGGSPVMNGSPPMQRPGSVVNGVPVVNGVTAMSPPRTPSSVGQLGNVGLNGQHHHQMSMSPPPIRSPQQHQSSPRVPQTPVMSANSQGGY